MKQAAIMFVAICLSAIVTSQAQAQRYHGGHRGYHGHHHGGTAVAVQIGGLGYSHYGGHHHGISVGYARPVYARPYYGGHYGYHRPYHGYRGYGYGCGYGGGYRGSGIYIGW